MQINYSAFDLNLKYPFTIAKFSRTSTPIMLVQIKHEGFIGYGEASMVPYMGENNATAISFLKKVNLSSFSYPFKMDEIMDYLDKLEKGLPAIKAAIDIALHDLSGKISNIPCYKMFGAKPENMPCTTFTIGIDKPEIIIKKVNDALADDFKLLKIKLGRENDQLLIETIRSVTNLPLYVDANQGWEDRQEALEKAIWLKEQGVLLIEQPMPKENVDGNAWLSAHSPIPTVGDEAVQRFSDVAKASNVYHGINIKLMKSAGMHEAFLMINEAKRLNLKLLIGCMSETSIATLAGIALAPLCDWADLDGPFLTSNNPYQKPIFNEGKYVLENLPGLGLKS